MNTKQKITGALLCLTLGMAGCGEKNPEAEAAATASAEAWLRLVDGGEYAESWREAASVFKGSLTEQGWVEMVTPVRQPMGKMESRRLIRASYKTSLPGAPDGEYVMIQYRTDFENKKAAIETITPMLDVDGQWRMSGYFIK